MQIHQFGLFFVGLFITAGSIPVLGINLWALLKTKRLKEYDDKFRLIFTTICTLYGINFVSRACDLPHQESERTSVIGSVLLLVLVPSLVYILLLKRSLKKAATLKQEQTPL